MSALTKLLERWESWCSLCCVRWARQSPSLWQTFALSLIYDPLMPPHIIPTISYSIFYRSFSYQHTLDVWSIVDAKYPFFCLSHLLEKKFLFRIALFLLGFLSSGQCVPLDFCYGELVLCSTFMMCPCMYLLAGTSGMLSQGLVGRGRGCNGSCCWGAATLALSPLSSLSTSFFSTSSLSPLSSSPTSVLPLTLSHLFSRLHKGVFRALL